MIRLKFLRRHWHDIGLVSAVAAVACLVLAWSDLVLVQKLLLLNLIIVLLHQFEEYSWPGGFPAIANMVMFPSPNPDRYPLNQNSSMVANIIFAYGFYLLPVFFPNVIWLGLAPVLGGAVVQFLTHVIYTNLKLRMFYNPGVATTIFGHLPIGVIYIYHISTHHLATGWDWFFGVLYLIAFVLLNFGVLENVLLRDKNSRYPFDDDEMKRFNVAEKLELARR
jgi:hypothetical protein